MARMSKIIPDQTSPYFWASYSKPDYQLYAHLTTIILVFFIAICKSQTPSYIHYDVRDGLPSNLVYCAYQDNRGLMWFGTNKGLACFDGMRFKVYGTKEGLPDTEILGLWEDSQERLWIANYRQQPCYRKHGRFFTFKEDSILKKIPPTSTTFTFFEDWEGKIMFSGLVPQITVLGKENVWVENFPVSVARFAYIDSCLLALTTKKIILCHSIERQEILYTFEAVPSAFLGCTVSGNKILYSLSDRLLLFEFENNKIKKLDEIITNLSGQAFTDRKGRFWICSRDNGAIYFDNLNKNLSNQKAILCDKKIMAMTEDQQGTLWFCTSGEGVYALPEKTAITYNDSDGLSSNNITALSISNKNRIWAGDDEGNIYHISCEKIVKSWNVDSKQRYNRCRQLLETPDNKLWIVSDAHLYFYDGKNTKTILPSLFAFKFILYQPDRLWYFCFSHLGFILHNKSYKNFRCHHRRFTALGQDGIGKLWIGRPDGLFCGPDSLAYNWGESFPILKTRISAIQTADKNHLWVVTPTSGLLWVEIADEAVKSVTIVNEHLSKPIENIQSLFRANDGRLWMATNKGVYGLNADWSVLHFDHFNGLPSDDINAVAVYGDTLWAGTVAGLTRLIFSTSSSRTDFQTVISSLRYRASDHIFQYNLLDSVFERHVITLPADARMIELDLSALDYCSRGNIQFSTTLNPELLPWYYWTPSNLMSWLKQSLEINVDSSLLETGVLNLGVQPNPGRYNLKITAISNSGAISEFPAEWSIIINPYWYQTIWAIIALWTLSSWGIWHYLKARAKNKELRLTVSRLRLQTLQTQINPHFMGNSVNALQQFFYPFQPTKASQYISLFTRLLRKTISVSENVFIPIEDELSYLRDYLALVKMRLGNNFDFEIQIPNAIPPNLPFPVMLLQPLVENAIIHGLAPDNESCLIIHFNYSEKSLECTILDNGVGIQSTLANKKRFLLIRKSKGLELISKKVLALNHLYKLDLEFSITDRKDDVPPCRGTRVTISFYPSFNYY